MFQIKLAIWGGGGFGLNQNFSRVRFVSFSGVCSSTKREVSKRRGHRKRNEERGEERKEGSTRAIQRHATRGGGCGGRALACWPMKKRGQKGQKKGKRMVGTSKTFARLGWRKRRFGDTETRRNERQTGRGGRQVSGTREEKKAHFEGEAQGSSEKKNKGLVAGGSDPHQRRRGQE